MTYVLLVGTDLQAGVTAKPSVPHSSSEASKHLHFPDVEHGDLVTGFDELTGIRGSNRSGAYYDDVVLDVHSLVFQ